MPIPTDLFNVRSSKLQDVLHGLRYLAERLDRTPWQRIGGESIPGRDVAVDPFVFSESPPGQLSLRRELFADRPSALDEVEAGRYELPKCAGDQRQVRWSHALRGARRRLMLKGAPGSGKTFITRLELARRADEAAQRLEEGAANPDCLEAPIWMTAKALTAASARELPKAFVHAMTTSLPGLEIGQHFHNWLCRAIAGGRSLVVVDALDELTLADRASFEAKSLQFDGLTAQMIVTCRTMHWEQRRLWLGWDCVEVVELAPLSPREHRIVCQKFFSGRPGLAEDLLLKLQHNYSLRHACRTPLLLAFACLLHAEGLVTDETNYPLLYAHTRRRLVSGQWRGMKPPWTGSTAKEEQLLKLLEGVSWKLFSKAPEQNRFTLDAWERAAVGSKNEEFLSLPPAEILDELELIGLIVPAGFEEQRGDRCWSFAHRSFLEFQAALAMSRMPQQRWLTYAARHFSYEPGWLEVLTFLAGIVDDASPLIAAVEANQCRKESLGKILKPIAKLVPELSPLLDELKRKKSASGDFLETMMFLKSRLVGAARRLEDGTIERVSKEIVEYFLRHYADCHRERAAAMLEQVSQNRRAAQSAYRYLVSEAPDDDARRISLDALSQALVIIGTPAAMKKLLALAANDEADVLLALCRNASEEFLERIIELATDTHSLSEEAIKALGRIGGEKALRRLIELSASRNIFVRNYAVAELRRFDDKPAIERLNELAADGHASTRVAAMSSLFALGVEGMRELAGEFLNREAPDLPYKIGMSRSDLAELFFALSAEELLKLTHTLGVDGWVRGIAAEKLFLVAQEESLPRLRELQRDLDPWVRVKATAAISMIDPGSTKQALLDYSMHRDWSVRLQATLAFGAIRQDWAMEQLLEMANDSNSVVHLAVAQCLDRRLEKRGVNTLFRLIHSYEDDVKTTAAGALWKIAWKHRMPIDKLRDGHV